MKEKHLKVKLSVTLKSSKEKETPKSIFFLKTLLFKKF